MKAEVFYQSIIDWRELPPDERHVCFSTLHSAALDAYLNAVRRIVPQQAALPVSVGSDRRTLAQLVGHMMEWDRFSIMSAGDILAGIRHPRAITSLEGYIEPDGSQPQFASIDAFNAYQAEKHASWSWEHLRDQAIESAMTLYTLFTHPSLLTAERLEATLPWKKRLRNGHLLENITMGWVLWILVLDHIAVEHTQEFGIG